MVPPVVDLRNRNANTARGVFQTSPIRSNSALLFEAIAEGNKRGAHALAADDRAVADGAGQPLVTQIKIEMVILRQSGIDEDGEEMVEKG